MRSSLALVRRAGLLLLADVLILIGKGRARRLPFVSLLIFFPWLRQTAFKPGIGSRVSRASKSDFVPRPRVGVVRRDAIADQQMPVALHRHALPDFLGGKMF